MLMYCLLFNWFWISSLGLFLFWELNNLVEQDKLSNPHNFLIEGYSTFITTASSFIAMLHIWFTFDCKWHKSRIMPMKSCKQNEICGVTKMKSVVVNWCEDIQAFPVFILPLTCKLTTFLQEKPFRSKFPVCCVIIWCVIPACHFENASAPLKGYEGKMVTSVMSLKRLLFIKTSLCHEGSAHAYCRKKAHLSLWLIYGTTLE